MFHLDQGDNFQCLQISRDLPQNGFRRGTGAPDIAGKMQPSGLGNEAIQWETVAFLQLNYRSLIQSENIDCYRV